MEGAGWIFTLGEFVAFGFIAVAASESDLDTNVVGALAITGWGGLIGLRVWEVKDAISRPKRHNQRLRAFRARATAPRPHARGGFGIYLAPATGSRSTSSPTIAGISLRF